MGLRHIIALLPAFVAVTSLSAAGVDFEREVQPILAKNCYDCHGDKKQKSGIRFDRKSSVFAPGDSGKPAVVPGKSSDSLLFQRIVTTNEDEVMPPKGDRLPDDQVAIIKKWIDEGANWPGVEEVKKHWAYVQPVRPNIPANTRSPIDHLVRERLQKENLKPSTPADRATLIRRVSLDLIGLPPSLAEVEAFVGNTSADAYEKIVERLLKSPHFGERWARPWLDAARYADTQGYEKDNRRTMWPYRDWVIKALNADLPFDQFTIEQIAGDMLPEATQDQKTATGFHRNTMTNTEGGTDNEEFRYEAVVDRVNTTWAVWMGSTMSCAQCHNHKYDPFTMKEYYQFMAFLNNTEDVDKDDEAPTMKVFAPGQEEHLATLRKKLKKAEGAFTAKARTQEIATSRERWETETINALTNWQVLDPTSFTSSGGATLTKTESRSIHARGINPTNDTYTVVATVGPGRVGAVRLEVLEVGEKKLLGRHENGSFVLRKFEAAIDDQLITFSRATADYSQKGNSVTNLLNGSGTGWAIDAADEKKRVRRSAYFTLAQALELSKPTEVKFKLLHGDKFPGANVARFRIYASSSENAGPPPGLPAEVRSALLVAKETRSEKEKDLIKAHFEEVAPDLKETREAYQAAKKTEKEFLDSIPHTSVMKELAKPRTTHRHVRGAYLTKGEVVEPGTPAAMHPFPTNEPANRLTVARWIVSTNNPLTARVVANRAWEHLFGRGIVETSEEFGTQGEPPSHPELLDWLACEFMHPSGTIAGKPASAWSYKALLKTIVMSATYQQSSRVDPALLARDPNNRLLARGPRVRLEAEALRDQALAVSGLLSRKIGGPSVMPPQPSGVWQVVYSGDRWETSKGEDKYRRGLYTFWRRTSPHPMMVSFDAPSREFCVLKRSRSNTPLQSLNLLNDPAFVECAQALAMNALLSGGAEPRDRIGWIFRSCVTRAPRESELARLVKLYEEQLENFRNDSDAARKLATSEIGSLPDKLDPAEAAALTAVANVIMNLDEFLTKG